MNKAMEEAIAQGFVPVYGDHLDPMDWFHPEGQSMHRTLYRQLGISHDTLASLKAQYVKGLIELDEYEARIESVLHRDSA